MASVVSLCALAAQLASQSAGAPQQRILLSSHRVSLDDRRRSGEVLLANPSDKPVTYKISIVEMEMDEFGKLSRITPGSTPDRSLKPYLKIAPQSVTLGRGGTQVIRLAVGSAKLTSGEYRSHLQVAVVPTESASATPDPTKISLRFQLAPTISMPVLFRTGNPMATASITHATSNGESLTFNLNRTGDRSIRGDVSIFAESSNKRKLLVRTLRNVTVYYPNTLRKLSVPLTGDARGASLRVEFAESGVSNPAKASGLVGRRE